MNIEIANQNQFDEIKSWLKNEKNTKGQSFDCNLSKIKYALDNNNLLVMSENKPIGFSALSNKGIEILNIKQDFQKRGYGRQLVDKSINILKERGSHLVLIECNPETSIPFWKKMGFTFDHSEKHGAETASYYSKKIEHLFQEKPHFIAKTEYLTIALYSKEKEWNKTIEASTDFKIKKHYLNDDNFFFEDEDGKYHSSILIYPLPEDVDSVISIRNGKEKICCGRIKYCEKTELDEAIYHGIIKTYCRNYALGKKSA